MPETRLRRGRALHYHSRARRVFIARGRRGPQGVESELVTAGQRFVVPAANLCADLLPQRCGQKFVIRMSVLSAGLGEGSIDAAVGEQLVTDVSDEFQFRGRNRAGCGARVRGAIILALFGTAPSMECAISSERYLHPATSPLKDADCGDVGGRGHMCHQQNNRWCRIRRFECAPRSAHPQRFAFCPRRTPPKNPVPTWMGARNYSSALPRKHRTRSPHGEYLLSHSKKSAKCWSSAARLQLRLGTFLGSIRKLNVWVLGRPASVGESPSPEELSNFWRSSSLLEFSLVRFILPKLRAITSRRARRPWYVSPPNQELHRARQTLTR